MLLLNCRLLKLFYASRMSNRLDPDQGRHYLGPDLGPNGLHRLIINKGQWCTLARK